MNHLKQLIDKLEESSNLAKEEWIDLMRGRNEETAQYLFERARYWQRKYFKIRFIPGGLLNSPIIVKMTAIIVESAEATDGQTDIV